MTPPPDKKSPEQQFDEKRILEMQNEYVDKIKDIVKKRLADGIEQIASFPQLFNEVVFKFQKYIVDELEGVRAKLYAKDIQKDTQKRLDEAIAMLNEKKQSFDQTYIPMISRVLFEYGKDSKGLDHKDLYRLAMGANAIIEAVEKNSKLTYEKVLNHEKLTKKEYAELFNDLRSFESGKNPLDNLKESGGWAIVHSMDSAQRFEMAKEYIKQLPTEAEAFVHKLLAANMLSVAQGRALWKWGKFPEDQIVHEQRVIEQDAAEIEKNLDRDDANQMVNFMKPSNLAGIALQLWRGTNLFLNLATHLPKGDFAGLIANPYVYTDVLAIAYGRTLTRGKSLTAVLRSPSAQEKQNIENKEARDRAKELMTRNVYFTEQYLENGGDLVLIRHIEKLRAENKDTEISVVDMLEEEKKIKKPTAKEKQRRAYLEKVAANPQQRLEAEELFTKIAKITTITLPKDVHDLYQEALKEQALAPL